MPTKLSSRAVFGLVGVTCFALLAAAWSLQYGPDRQQPCPLCILQRYLFMALGGVCLLAAAHGPQRTGQLVYAAIADLLTTLGIGVAGWHLTKGVSMTSCLADPIGDFVNGLPMANWWPEYLFATGGCADKHPPILGLSAAGWSLVWFCVFAVAIAAVAISTIRTKAYR